MQEVTKKTQEISDLVKENKELKDFYYLWETERDKLVLEKQRAETLALRLQQDNTELICSKDEILLKFFMLSCELSRLMKKVQIN